MEPNKERIQLWVDALRSGKYKQGRHALAYELDNQKFFCCLGVACEVAIENGLEIEVTRQGESCRTCIFYDLSEGLLPTRVQKWFGLPSLNPVVHHTNSTTKRCWLWMSLSGLNDNGTPFEQIAIDIENTYLNTKEA